MQATTDLHVTQLADFQVLQCTPNFYCHHHIQGQIFEGLKQITEAHHKYAAALLHLAQLSCNNSQDICTTGLFLITARAMAGKPDIYWLISMILSARAGASNNLDESR